MRRELSRAQHCGGARLTALLGLLLQHHTHSLAAEVLRPTQLPAQLVVRSSTAPAPSASGPAVPEREHAA